MDSGERKPRRSDDGLSIRPQIRFQPNMQYECVVPAQAGTHNPWHKLSKDIRPGYGAEPLRRMGPRLHGDDAEML